MAAQPAEDPAFTERRQKAFDFASDATKQLLTLSTAVITVTVTFSKDVFTHVSGGAKGILFWAWGLYLLSIISGFLTLLALTGTLEPKPGADVTPSIRGRNIVFLSSVMVLSFIVATGFVVLFGISAF